MSVTVWTVVLRATSTLGLGTTDLQPGPATWPACTRPGGPRNEEALAWSSVPPDPFRVRLGSE
jgi:hypothetical protein